MLKLMSNVQRKQKKYLCAGKLESASLIIPTHIAQKVWKKIKELNLKVLVESRLQVRYQLKQLSDSILTFIHFSGQKSAGNL